MNLEYAIGCKNLQQDLTKEMIRDSHSSVPIVTVDNCDACRRYFQIIDFWNQQICKGMGWKYNG